MDAKDAILRMIKEAVEETIDEKEHRPKHHVGDLDEELVKKHRVFRRAKQEIQDKAEVKAKELQLRFQREMDEYTEQLEEEVRVVHDDFWNDVYKKNNLDPNGQYNINIKEKKVYQYIDLDNPFRF